MERDVKINDLDNPRAKTGVRDNNGIIRRQAQPNLLIKLQDIFFVCLKNWKWFVLSIGICLGIAYYQIKKTPNLYQRTASIMIKGDERNPTTISALRELGVETAPQNVSNEIMAITSVDIASQVARRLNLDVEYFHEESFHNQVVYGTQLPVNIKFHDLADEETLSCLLELRADSTVKISKIVYRGEPATGSFVMKLGQTRKTPVGVITVEPSSTYRAGDTDRLIVEKHNMASAIGSVSGRVHAYLRSREATLIDISYVDNSIQRAEDVLNTLVQVYNESWISDKNKITESTNAFINERISAIEKELSLVENTIADYKSENLMLDVDAAGSLATSKAQQAEEASYTIDNQIYMIEYMKDYITDGQHENKLLPLNTGIGNQSIEQQMGEYNKIILQRNGHLAHSSEQNPLVMDLNESLDILRTSIIQSLDNELINLTTQKNSIEARHQDAIEKITANPRQSIYVNSIERQKNVKENLYLFLLQKREENELSQAFTAYNSRLIEPPHGSWTPIAPVPNNTYMLALIIGFAIPASILIIKEGFNTVVRGRKDIEQLSVPFVGEIPLDSNADKKAKQLAKQKKKMRKKGKHLREPSSEFVVVEKSRNVMNEAFRVVRSNLEFILGFENKHHIIMVTSLNPSSGKTFITANLSSSLGINNKRVIAVDLDMRKGTLSKYANKPIYGVSNYLSGQVEDYRTLIVHAANIDILPCGTLPPNPTELLYNDAFKKMIDELKEEYDYVFLDCPPVEVVADSAIINRYADMTLFVIRAQLLDRAFLPDVEKWYTEGRYNNLSVILNGTTDAFSRYGYHKYGYRYGYHYGNYGYGYGNEKD